jgi:uncharacterized protein YcfJ
MWVKSIAVAAALGFGAVAHADHDDGRYRGRGHGHAYGHRTTEYVYARVVDVDPIVRYVTVEQPRRECWNEIVSEPARGVAGPTIAGGVVGAAIGRQFGSGNDRDALTMLGAIAGAAVANQRAVRNRGYPTRDVAIERCEVVRDHYTEERIDGYRVTYLHDGRRHTMVTDVPPGDRVRLAVQVRPVAYRVRY